MTPKPCSSSVHRSEPQQHVISVKWLKNDSVHEKVQRRTLQRYSANQNLLYMVNNNCFSEVYSQPGGHTHTAFTDFK